MVAVKILPRESIHMPSRRKFIQTSVMAGTALALSSVASGRASAQTSPTLNLYLAVWPSLTGLRLSWNTPSPRHLATEFSHMLWRYVQDNGGRWKTLLNSAFSKTAPIGHTSLLAEMEHQNGSIGGRLLFSNTGGSPGFYKNDNSIYSPLPFSTKRYPERYRRCPVFCAPIVLGFYLDEVLAGHTDDGEWESWSDYEYRVSQNKNFRVRKYTAKGESAVRIFERLKHIPRHTNTRNKEVGAPLHFGLNTTSVRVVDDFHNKRAMTKYMIGDYKYEIHGGCGNAVASVLEAAGLGHLIPRSARFGMNVNLNKFKNVILPVILGSGGFRGSQPMDDDLIADLSRVPQTWGSGDAIRLIDPNYWYVELPVGAGNEWYVRKVAAIVDDSGRPGVGGSKGSGMGLRML